MPKYSYIAYLAIYTCILTLVIYFIRVAFFGSGQFSEDIFVEPQPAGVERHFSDIHPHTHDEQEAVYADIFQRFFQRHLDDKKDQVDIHYIPNDFSGEVVLSYTPIVEHFLFRPYNLQNMSQGIDVFFHKSIDDTRGRMKKRRIHMYAPHALPLDEFTSVFVHEFAHYLDIYTYKNRGNTDLSKLFYKISWNTPTQMLKGSQLDDFVSGYSMTNQYEDFAESYVYFLLHNEDFLRKAEKNEKLRAKYDFFVQHVFPQLVTGIDVSDVEQYDEYYWDSTKIPINVKKFLQSDILEL